MCLIRWRLLEQLGSLAGLRGPPWCAGGNERKRRALQWPVHLLPSRHLGWLVLRNEWKVALLRGARAKEPQVLGLNRDSPIALKLAEPQFPCL